MGDGRVRRRGIFLLSPAAWPTWPLGLDRELVSSRGLGRYCLEIGGGERSLLASARETASARHVAENERFGAHLGGAWDEGGCLAATERRIGALSNKLATSGRVASGLAGRPGAAGESGTNHSYDDSPCTSCTRPPDAASSRTPRLITECCAGQVVGQQLIELVV